MEKNQEQPSAISVVILCYKEGQPAVDFVRKVERALGERGLSYELVLVANYFAREKDDPKVRENSKLLGALSAENPRIVLVEKEKEGGFGWDMRSGIDRATGETIAVVDGDGQMLSEDILRVYDILRLGDYDLVKTFRIRRDDGSWRGTISAYYNLFLRLVFPRVFTSDVNGKPKIFTRAALKRLHLTSSDWFIDAEMLIQASYKGFRIVEVSTAFNEMTHRKSYIKPAAILESIRNIIWYRLTRMGELHEKT